MGGDTKVASKKIRKLEKEKKAGGRKNPRRGCVQEKGEKEGGNHKGKEKPERRKKVRKNNEITFKKEAKVQGPVTVFKKKEEEGRQRQVKKIEVHYSKKKKRVKQGGAANLREK